MSALKHLAFVDCGFQQLLTSVYFSTIFATFFVFDKALKVFIFCFFNLYRTLPLGAVIRDRFFFLISVGCLANFVNARKVLCCSSSGNSSC